MKKILTLIVCALAFKLCVLGQSLHFDGVNDYVELENTLAGTYSGLTIEGWVNIEQYPDGGQEKILDFGGPESRITLITNADGSLLFGIEGNNTSVDGMANTYDIPTGEWVHLAGVWNGVDSINIFMNGEMLNSNYIEPSIDTLTIWNGTKLFLGARYSQQEYFHGAIESLSFWDRPLSNFEIGQLLNCPPQVGDFGLRAFWPFEEGLGQVTEGINCEACNGDIFGASWSAIVSGSRIQGCASPEACNYNPAASCDDGSCYSCDIPASHCGEGTTWDESSQTCIVANVSDTDFDGCVGINDFLVHLSNFGSGCDPEPAWACGDPMGYQGYYYATVQIGEQCWFAENLRSGNYRNEETIPNGLNDEAWMTTTTGAYSIYGYPGSDCNENSPNGDACYEDWSFNEFGLLYNWMSVNDIRGICPAGWKVPSDEDWTMMTNFIGGVSVGGDVLKALNGWAYNGEGTDIVNFSGLPGGQRLPSGDFTGAGGSGFWWTSTPTLNDAWHRILVSDSDAVTRSNTSQLTGMSVRCIKDTE